MWSSEFECVPSAIITLFVLAQLTFVLLLSRVAVEEENTSC